jgi:transketolase
MRDTFARTLNDIAQTDPKVFIVVADISPAGSMVKFREQFPDHFINVGVAEQSMIGMAAGLAMRGCTTFAYTIATFAGYRPFEQIRDDICYQNLPVTIVGIGGGVSYSTLGATHHAQEDVAVLGAIPNMSILAPCDPLETEAATWAAAKHDGPVYLRLGKAGEPNLTAEAPDPFVFGKLRHIKAGRRVCLVAYGPIMKMVLDAAARLEAQLGEPVAVVSAHTVKPLDETGVLELFRDYETVAVVEEHSVRGGLGQAVKSLAWDASTRANVLAFGLRDEFIHLYGSQGDVWTAHGLTLDAIVGGVLAKTPAPAHR